MENVIDIRLIKMNVEGKDKLEILKIVSEIAYENEIIESEEVYYLGLIKREEECTTGFGKGFAIPHCKNATVKKPAVIVCKLKNSIEWKSMDGEPVDFVMALAVPEVEAGTTHLKILSQIARVLMDDEFTNKLKQSKTEKEIYSLLRNKVKEGE